MNQCNCMELREMVDQFQDKLYHASREASGIKYELGHEIEVLKEALISISNNSCCECCGQAAIVASKALEQVRGGK